MNQASDLENNNTLLILQFIYLNFINTDFQNTHTGDEYK